MADYRTFQEIADSLGVGIDTMHRADRKFGEQLGINMFRQATPTSRGSKVKCLSVDDANRLFDFLREKDSAPDTEYKNPTTQRVYGSFYILQLIPEALPNRIKIGYTDNLEARIEEHRCSAPTAKLLASWECKRSWDQAAMDSITRKDCKLVKNEVYEGDVDLFIQRANDFFGVMPDPDTRILLSEHSPINDKENV